MEHIEYVDEIDERFSQRLHVILGNAVTDPIYHDIEKAAGVYADLKSAALVAEARREVWKEAKELLKSYGAGWIEVRYVDIAGEIDRLSSVGGNEQ